ncbi:MAG: restriction endonuclease subunit S [Thaumarchaeota archaeon]|nr:restriction endonuclease subunit S [Nitrososphaerota archaeon]
MDVKPRKGYKLVKTLFGKYEEIPDSWEISSLTHKDILYLSSGEAIGNITLKGKYPVYGSNGIIGYTEQYNEDDAILIGRVGSSGSIHYLDQKVWVTDNVLISKMNKKLLKKFCYYALKHAKLERFATKSAQPLLTQSILKIVKIKIPSKTEQQKIASILSGVDATIEATQKVIDKTEKLKKGLMQQLLIRGIGHTKSKKITFGRHFIEYNIPDDWDLTTLNVCATVHGRIGWKNLRSDEYVESGFLMLSVWSLIDTLYGINFTKGIKRLSKFRYDESPEIQLYNDDVLVAKDGDIGRIGFVKKLPEPATVNSHVVIVRVHNKSPNPEFLYWFFKSKQFQTYCKAFTSGTTVPLFTQKDLRNSIIPLPKIAEQQKIASILSGVDAISTLLVTKIRMRLATFLKLLSLSVL